MRSFGARPGKLFVLMMSESMIVSLISVIAGLGVGHLLVGCIATWLTYTKHIHITGWLFLSEETWLIPASLIVGALAALLPAIRVYKIDIYKTLVQR
jgi:putative ABC transport system permease protein